MFLLSTIREHVSRSVLRVPQNFSEFDDIHIALKKTKNIQEIFQFKKYFQIIIRLMNSETATAEI